MSKFKPVLVHHGIKGMRWGVRRFLNKDGTLTEAGKKRYRTDDVREAKRRSTAATVAATFAGVSAIQTARNYKRYKETVNYLTEGEFGAIPVRSAVLAGAKQAGKMAVITGLAAYGGMKLVSHIKNSSSKNKGADSEQENK